MARPRQILKPWGKVGVDIPKGTTPSELLKKAKLDWDVYVEDTFREDGVKASNREIVKIDGKKKENLGPCGPKYTPAQNLDVFKFFDKFVEQEDMAIETVGQIDGGRHIWGLMKMNKGFTLPGRDRVEGYLLISHPHIYGKSLTVLLTPTRVVCLNQIPLLVNKGLAVRYRMSHVNEFDLAQQVKAKHTVSHSVKQLEDFEEQARFLASKQLKGDQLERFVTGVFQPKLLLEAGDEPLDASAFNKTVTRTLNLFDSQPGANMSKGSWWSALNAVTYYIDHEYGDSENNRLREMWFRKGAARSRNARDLALARAGSKKAA